MSAIKTLTAFGVQGVYRTNAENQSGNGTTGDVSFDNLYPAILQCFVIILSGYVAGRVGLISSTQGKGIGTFVSTFCLPALLFKNMCELNFREVNWTFLVGILISKTFIFIVVCVLVVIGKRPINFGYAGLFAIFCTQSNDFALGYPILQALYSSSHPEYLKYIYLIAPISLVILNPIGFTLMEIQHRRAHSEQGPNSGKCSLVLSILRGVVTNPIVFMTVIGIICNFIFQQKVPVLLEDILKVLGDAFSASALFYLGLNLVGKIQSQTGMNLLVPALLIGAKTLLLPLVTWEVVGWLENSAACNESEALSMYGFLYGTFPTAPSVFLYASKYGFAQDTVSTGMVAGTFLSAPLMFVSAKMMTVIVNNELDYTTLLMDTSFDTSIISMIGCVWVLGIFVLSRRWKQVPHRFTIGLIVSQLLACVGMVIYGAHGGHGAIPLWRYYLQLILLLVGVFSSRCWTAVLALVLCLLHIRSLCYVLRIQNWLILFGYGLPIFATGLVFVIGNKDIDKEVDPSFHYGMVQTVTSIFVLGVSAVITVGSLIAYMRYDRLSSNHDDLSTEDTDRESRPQRSDASNQSASQNRNADAETAQYNQLTDSSEENNYRACGVSLNISSSCHSIEDIIPFPPGGKDEITRLLEDDCDSSEALLHEVINERTCLLQKCTPEQRVACRTRLRSYLMDTSVMRADDPQMESRSHPDQRSEYQTGHHLILLLLLLLSIFVGLFLCFWRLFNHHPTGIYIEIEFLDCIFNYGQGFFIFAIFGFDTKLVFSPAVRRVRRWIYGVENVHLPRQDDLDEETKQTCEQFVEYHREQCTTHIVKDLRYRFRMYKQVFTGTSMCDWLIKVGLVQDRGEAVAYGRKLVLGRVISHVASEHHFHDLPYFYRFLATDGYSGC